MKRVLSSRDVWAGVPLVAIGALGFYFSGSGSSSVDPAGNLFPRMIGIGLIVVGIVITLRGLLARGGSFAAFPIRSCAAITGGVLAFAFLIERAGLGLAVLAAVLISTLGFRGTRFGAGLIFGVGLAAATYVLFVGLLGQPIKLVPGF
jgi:Tripartite tricarboxylate transporter TctB family.